MEEIVPNFASTTSFLPSFFFYFQLFAIIFMPPSIIPSILSFLCWIFFVFEHHLAYIARMTGKLRDLFQRGPGVLYYKSGVWLWWHLSFSFRFKKKKDFIYLFFREGQGRRKRGKETSMCGCLSSAPYWDLACNPGMCPDWELNQQPFGSQACAQSTEPHQPGLL